MELVEGAAQVGICLASILFSLPTELRVDGCFKQNAGKVGREKGGWRGELWELWCRLSKKKRTPCKRRNGEQEGWVVIER